MKTLCRLSVVIFLLCSAFPSRAAAPTYSVTTLADSGEGSLRAALTAANLSKGGTIDFTVSGTITLSTALPSVTAPVVIDGSTAPGFTTDPVVSIDFAGNNGLILAKGSNASVIRGLSLVKSTQGALTLEAPGITVEDNFIGLGTDGSLVGNTDDGIRITSTSTGNLIGHSNPVSGIEFSTADEDSFPDQPVSSWLGLKNNAAVADQYLMCGTSNANGLLYIGALTGGGSSYTVQYPDPATSSTTAYGPENLTGGSVRVVGSYTKSDDTIVNHGFVWSGTPSQLPSGGTYVTVDYPKAKQQYLHSTMQDLAVGNSDGPKLGALLAIPGSETAYIYDVTNAAFVTNVAYPGAATTVVYGIWYNGPTGYTICGGFSTSRTSNITDQNQPLKNSSGFMVDYNPAKKAFTNWTKFKYPNGTTGIAYDTQFTGISSAEPGVYTLSANTVQTNSGNPVRGSLVSIRRTEADHFSIADWIDLDFPSQPTGITSANSAYGNNVVGTVAASPSFAYEATVTTEFQRSNVISGNGGNGILVTGSRDNVIAMNFIGTNVMGTAAIANGQNGIYLTGASTQNLIGGQAPSDNDPTGDKGFMTPVFQRPLQGNLISGNTLNGVLIDARSSTNVLSGNYIGTDETGSASLGNAANGIDIEAASNSNSLIGCTFFENPFVYYNVIGGNGENGVLVNNSNNTTIHANFIGLGANNVALVPNGDDGVLISGTSNTVEIGGPIPLGNVISGNTGNGIEVTDKASNFKSFNTFDGIPAFTTVAAPNGKDGILITATGGGHVIQTTIVSGNLGNGIEIGGDASGVQITDTGVGTTTVINGIIPNQLDGVLIDGTAHNIDIGGFQNSIIPTNFFSGNLGYGLAIIDGAHNITVVHTNVGIAAGTTEDPLPNQEGGIYLGQGTSANIIGGNPTALQDKIQSNDGDGLTIVSSTKNTVTANTITLNNTGVFATGICTGTTLTNNSIQGNTTDFDISGATGIKVTPAP